VSKKRVDVDTSMLFNCMRHLSVLSPFAALTYFFLSLAFFSPVLRELWNHKAVDRAGRNKPQTAKIEIYRERADDDVARHDAGK
jgi:hypothetical protein